VIQDVFRIYLLRSPPSLSLFFWGVVQHTFGVGRFNENQLITQHTYIHLTQLSAAACCLTHHIQYITHQINNFVYIYHPSIPSQTANRKQSTLTIIILSILSKQYAITSRNVRPRPSRKAILPHHQCLLLLPRRQRNRPQRRVLEASIQHR
jgi:hypothetical protein